MEEEGLNPSVTDSSGMSKDNEMFKPLAGESSGEDAIEVESLCVNCGKNGTTKLLLTIIPFYKEVILSSFSCLHCGFANNEIQSAGEIQPQGVEFKLKMAGSQDLNRKIVKSDYASISIPEVDFEIPPLSQKGEVTTVEGILRRTMDGLSQEQPDRQREYPEAYEQIQKFIQKLEDFVNDGKGFSLILRDYSGKSFICPPSDHLPGNTDPQLTTSHFNRTTEENHSLGIFAEVEEKEAKTNEDEDAVLDTVETLREEIHTFPTICSSCGSACETKMKMVTIPYFKEAIIMATDCDHCGYKTNEVKGGGGIEDKGRRIILKVENVDDLSRDVLKAETCSIEIPALELEVGAGTLGGKFTTLEGILNDMKDQILDSHSKFIGDSEPGMREKVEAFSSRFSKFLSLEEPFSIVFDDPAGNSYVQNIQAPDEDPQLNITSYERTFEQNEELGLNDMNTENYLPLPPIDE